MIEINGRKIGPGYPAYIVAEMSANHNQDFDYAVTTILEAGKAGADAIKVQTYTPDTMTLPGIELHDTIWKGRTLYDLYEEAHMPWGWQPALKGIAESIGLDFFSTPFDMTAVDFLETINVPAYKIASFEIVDFALLRKIAMTGKPIILSTGMASIYEIEDALNIISAHNQQVVLLKCNSSYPAKLDEMNLITIPHMADIFGVSVGLSDHTLGPTSAIVAVTLGACIIEKHFALSRRIDTPDSRFSMEPWEFDRMVDAIREAEETFGIELFGPTKSELSSDVFRRSLWVVDDVKKGELFTIDNVKALRPNYGLHPRYFTQALIGKAKMDIVKGTPLELEMIQSQ